MTPYNPDWPFPQYDEEGNRLLPPDWNRQPSQQEVFDELGEAPF